MSGPVGLPDVELARRLRREGIRAAIGAPMQTGLRRLAVQVSALDVVECNRVLPAAGGRRRMEPDKLLRSIMAKAAVRALYVLGLDDGEVELDIDELGRAVIVAVEPVGGRRGAVDGVVVAGERAVTPGGSLERVWTFATVRTPPSSRTLTYLPASPPAYTAPVQAATGQYAGDALVGGVSGEFDGILLGADPEFVLVTPEGKIAPASRYLPPQGDAGCDSVVVRGVRRWPLVELRPAPAAEPATLVRQLRQLLRQAAGRLRDAPQLAWRAGAMPVSGFPLGGHVHLSGVALTAERLRALDNAIALPLRLLEPPSAAARRPRYGALGDFRRQPHGGFEYRTPPSWLLSPRLAGGVLALAKIAATHAGELAASRPLDEERVRDAFYGEGDRQLLLDGVRMMYAAIARMEGYAAYKMWVDPIFQAVERGTTWDETADIRVKWGIK